MIGNFLSILVKLLIITIFSFLCFYLFRIINELDIERMIIQSLMVAGISSAFGMIIALLLRKELNANLLATGITTIFAILCGTFIPMDQMPKILQFINYINPFTWVLRI